LYLVDMIFCWKPNVHVTYLLFDVEYGYKMGLIHFVLYVPE